MLAIALAAQILVVLDISVVNTALPTIGRSLHLRGGDLSWLVTAYLLMSGGGLLLGGRIADLFPRRRVFLTGLAVFTMASVSSALAASAGVLIAARAGQGLGAALMTPAALSLIITTYTGAQRTRGLTLWGMVGSIGIAAGVLFGGALTTWAGWQMIFWINVPIGAIAFCIAVIKLPKQPATHTGFAKLDLPGGAAVVLGLGTLIFGIESITSHGWTSPQTIAAFTAAIALLAAFNMIERRVASPLIPPHTWRMRSLVAGTGTMAGVTAILVGVIFLVSIFCQTVLGYSALRTGLALLPLAAAITASAHVAGHLLQRPRSAHRRHLRPSRGRRRRIPAPARDVPSRQLCDHAAARRDRSRPRSRRRVHRRLDLGHGPGTSRSCRHGVRAAHDRTRDRRRARRGCPRCRCRLGRNPRDRRGRRSRNRARIRGSRRARPDRRSRIGAHAAQDQSHRGRTRPHALSDSDSDSALKGGVRVSFIRA